METDGGGWIVFQRRQDGTVDFYRSWADYQSGFGDLKYEFWLGNDILRDLTGSGQWELRVEMEDWQPNTSRASYGEFAVTSDEYTLYVGSYDAQSTVRDSMAYHNRHPFTTKNRENDAHVTSNCAVKYRSAWWYSTCHKANLNGVYYQQADVAHAGEGIQWTGWKGYFYSLKKCSMKVRQLNKLQR
ncbi:ryncolin-1-like [Asterias rubens]|uniref:ryncolin-1-like n=1 Tax=Asterias rubens TaxID=7604 RepID=UPI001455D9A0|nr:ryncolin-1-like [Asterias rubens]